MNYKFPVIRTIKDVEHAIDRDYFMVANRDGHVIINYLYSSSDVFPDIDPNCDIAKIRREFRGLIFDDAGNIIRRPYHKFFNVGERSDTTLQALDVSKPHIIFDKLDGSMIAPYIVGLDLIWGTKMGDTEVAKQVDEFIKTSPIRYRDFAYNMIGRGFTPIFEWCSRSQRIVLDYRKDELILTAVRKIDTGEYTSLSEMQNITGQDIPLCPIVYDSFSENFMQHTKVAEDIEGFVIRWDDGHMVKIKCDWYCQLHRVKSEIAYERGVVSLILNGNMDDLKPLMPQEDLAAINTYESQFNKGLEKCVMHIAQDCLVVANGNISRKDFALNYSNDMEAFEKQIIFKLWDSGLSNVTRNDIRELLKDVILRQCGKNTKFDELRKTKLFEDVPVWRGVEIDDE